MKLEDNKIIQSLLRRFNSYTFDQAQEIAELLDLDTDDIAGELYRNETDVIYALRTVILNTTRVELIKGGEFDNRNLISVLFREMANDESIFDFPGINFDMFNLPRFYRLRIVDYPSKYPNVKSYEDMSNIFKDLSESLPEDKYKVSKWILKQLG